MKDTCWALPTPVELPLSGFFIHPKNQGALSAGPLIILGSIIQPQTLLANGRESNAEQAPL
jgi:hypothetical protein